VRLARQILALFAAGTMAWAAIGRNAALCPDEQAETSHDHGAPSSSHCCLTSACHAPTVSPVATPLEVPAADVASSISSVTLTLESAETPVPPTPPPTSLDQAV